MAPLMRKMLDQNITYNLVYTQQHQENIHEILALYKLPKPSICMYDFDEAKTKVSFVKWFISTFTKIIFQNKKYIPTPGFVLTHGDTFTTWMAALMGNISKSTVCHVESGLRSHSLLSPFPEEISRLVTFYLSDIYFCSDDKAISNLKNFSGKKINLEGNTLLDGVRFALSNSEKPNFSFQDSPYAMVSIHRFENIFTSRLTDTILPILFDIAKKFKLVFTLHPSTRERLRNLEIFDKLNYHPNIELYPRFSFSDWINICNSAEFVITDGGSNQEELYYLGIPTMLFRYETERNEGLCSNVILTKFDETTIESFLTNYQTLRKDLTLPDFSPSQTIIDTIMQITLT